MTETTMRASAGFSLLEVMIAMVLLAFVMLAMGTAQLHSLRFASDTDNRSQAMYLAEDLMDTLLTGPSTDPRLVVIPGVERADLGNPIDLADDTSDDRVGAVNAAGVGETTQFNRFWQVDDVPGAVKLELNPDSLLRRVTVRVSWNSSSGPQNSVRLMGVR